MPLVKEWVEGLALSAKTGVATESVDNLVRQIMSEFARLEGETISLGREAEDARRAERLTQASLKDAMAQTEPLQFKVKQLRWALEFVRDCDLSSSLQAVSVKNVVNTVLENTK